jgi:hypothetical protein
MERVPHGDVPFLGTAESIRHELFLSRSKRSTSMSYFPHITVWRIGEAILIIQAPTHHAAAVGYKCIQGMKESASNRPPRAGRGRMDLRCGLLYENQGILP